MRDIFIGRYFTVIHAYYPFCSLSALLTRYLRRYLQPRSQDTASDIKAAMCSGLVCMCALLCAGNTYSKSLFIHINIIIWLPPTSAAHVRRKSGVIPRFSVAWNKTESSGELPQRQVVSYQELYPGQAGLRRPGTWTHTKNIGLGQFFWHACRRSAQSHCKPGRPWPTSEHRKDATSHDVISCKISISKSYTV